MMGGLLASSADNASPPQVRHLMALFPQLDATMAGFALEEAGGDVNRAAAALSESLAIEASSKRDALASAAEARNNNSRPGARSTSRSSTGPVASVPVNSTVVKAPVVSSAARKTSPKPSLDPKDVFKPKAMPNEERIRLAAVRLAGYPQALDTILYMINSCLQNPNEEKYRQVKTTNKAFMEKVASAPAEAWSGFLNSVGFQKDGEWLRLGANFDMWNLVVGRDVLEALQLTDAYRTAKANESFTAMLQEASKVASPEERAKREELRRLLPSEPDEGTAGTTRINVTFGNGPYAAARRRFAADDTLADVIRWLGSVHSTRVAEALRAGEVSLRNETLLDAVDLDVSKDGDKTLHALGLWPGAELAVRTKV